MKKTKWPEMLTHTHEDNLGREFTYHHRDMGTCFQHVGNPMCACGPILAFMDDTMSIPGLCAKLDTLSHYLVN